MTKMQRPKTVFIVLFTLHHVLSSISFVAIFLECMTTVFQLLLHHSCSTEKNELMLSKIEMRDTKNMNIGIHCEEHIGSKTMYGEA